jgi:hypothetical protein
MPDQSPVYCVFERNGFGSRQENASTKARALVLINQNRTGSKKSFAWRPQLFQAKVCPSLDAGAVPVRDRNASKQKLKRSGQQAGSA